jgi:formamidopyrimidine-DNA glycosylase
MPELPEVETVKNGLLRSIKDTSIKDVWVSNKKLRFPLSLKKLKTIVDSPILGISRRAKYLLFDLGDSVLLNHLGMTGTWRESTESVLHDHVKLKLSGNKTLVFNDPRRFGFFAISEKHSLHEHAFLKHLGPEPLEQDFTPEYLQKKAHKKIVPVKNFIMDQKIVVGVGNIYASEALFLSSIKPTREAKKLKDHEAELLVTNIQVVLQKAILAGGSYIRDFKSLEGAASFQHQFQVYDKEGEACIDCKKPIQRIVQAGRSTFFCKSCQK